MGGNFIMTHLVQTGPFGGETFEHGRDRLIARNLCFFPASRPGCPEGILYSLTIGARLSILPHLPSYLAFLFAPFDETPIFYPPSTHLSPIIRPPSILHVHLYPVPSFLRLATT